MPNYWNVYQTELKRRIRNEYNESKAEKTWKESCLLYTSDAADE